MIAMSDAVRAAGVADNTFKAVFFAVVRKSRRILQPGMSMV